MSKLSIENVKDYFASHSCLLLETEYINDKTPMEYQCICGNKSKIRYSNFRSGQRCQKCKAKKSSALNTKYSYEDVVLILKQNQCELLETKDTYINSQAYMRYICNCGEESSTTFSLFLTGRRCLNCRSERRAKTRRAPIEKIRELLSSEGYTLLSEEYLNTSTPVRFLCPRGHEHQISMDNWKRGKQRCRMCYREDNIGENHPNWIHDRIEKAKFDSIRRRCFSMLHATLKATGNKKNGKTYSLLGYTPKELYNHLSGFPTWGALQKYKWHIDHIFPIDAFVKHGIFDLHIINALDNLKPMLGKDNIIKSNKYNKTKFKKYLKQNHSIDITSQP